MLSEYENSKDKFYDIITSVLLPRGRSSAKFEWNKNEDAEAYFDLETGEEWRAPFGERQWKLGVVPLKIISNHHIIISYHISLFKHGGPSGNKPDLPVAI